MSIVMLGTNSTVSLVAGVCVPEEAKQRSLSERLSTDGTLDPKTFSI